MAAESVLQKQPVPKTVHLCYNQTKGGNAMLEVVFSESAAGALSFVMLDGGSSGGVTSVILSRRDGRKPTKAELRAAQKEIEARDRCAWAQAVPLGGSREDILTFPLSLSVGKIDEAGIGAKREAAISHLMGIYPSIRAETTQAMLSSARKSLSAFSEHAKDGEPIRIWTSDNPDDACGTYWLMEQMRLFSLADADITLVRLPRFSEDENGKVYPCRGWGEVEPHRWGSLAAAHSEPLSPGMACAMAAHWRELQKENAPLRAVLGGVLASVPETLYDTYILQEIEKAETQFLQEEVIGAVLLNYPFGLSDTWIALRMEQFIKDGWLAPVTAPKRDDPIYHRILRKHKTERDKP